MNIIIGSAQSPILASAQSRAELEAAASRRGVESVVANSRADLMRELPRADAIWIEPATYDAEFVATLRRDVGHLKWIQLMSTGFDAIERYGAPDGVVVTNAGDAYAPLVAEHAVALLLALGRGLPDALDSGAKHQWKSEIGARVTTLDGAAVTIFGFGRIGREIALRLRPFGARIIAVTQRGRAEPLADETLPSEKLGDALKISAALIVAAPLTKSTHQAIGEKEFSALPRHAFVINIGRGPIIDAAALSHALEKGLIGGAGLDVTDPEPLPLDDPLWACKNIIVTPHIAAMGGALPARRLAAILERNLDHFINGRELENRIF